MRSIEEFFASVYCSQRGGGGCLMEVMEDLLPQECRCRGRDGDRKEAGEGEPAYAGRDGGGRVEGGRRVRARERMAVRRLLCRPIRRGAPSRLMLDVPVYFTATDPALTEYVMRNSRLVHHA